MAALANLDALRAAMLAPKVRKTIVKTMPVVGNGGIFVDGWAAVGSDLPGVAPVAAAVPNASTSGCWMPEALDSGQMWIAEAVVTSWITSGSLTRAGLMLYDRLSHQSGLSGRGTATVTVTIASPAVVTMATHGLVANTPIVFTTTGALPTGIVAGTTYYVSATALAAGTFQISATPGGASINTSGTQSGVHTGTAAQIANLPTAALTRYTSGVGVQAMVQVYTAFGLTAVTFTVSYTNQAGVSGRTSRGTFIGGTGQREAGFCSGPIPLQAGDTGVRSVESFTISGDTATQGSAGITLMKPLAFVYAGDHVGQGMVWDGLQGGGLVELLNNACLCGLLWQEGSVTSAPSVSLYTSVIRS